MLAPIDELLVDPVTDVLINGPEEVWVVAENGLQLTQLAFADDEEVRTFAVRLATIAGRPLDDAHPFVDIQFDGLRIHAILPPLVPRTHISIRRLSRQNHSVDELLGRCDASSDLLDIISSRRNFLISGGTGAGKTTLLSALLAHADPTSRIAVIEDTKEIATSHPHVVSLQSRLSNSEGKGEVTLRDLVRQSLRMRPDRLFIGEVRGGEVIDLLAALNTGHRGSGGTIHANGPLEVPARIESMAIFAGVPADAARRLFFTAIDLVIHLRTCQRRGVESISLTTHDAIIPLAHYDDSGMRL